jgi:hypothetical protein
VSRIVYGWERVEVAKLAADLARVPQDTYDEMKDTVVEATRMLTEKWRANATKSAGDTGRLYPKTIHGTIRRAGVQAVEGTIKPRAHMKQGGMSFEYGGPTRATKSTGGPFPRTGGGFWGGPAIGQKVGQSEPHLDMNRAADMVFPWFEQRIARLGDIYL